MHKAFANKNLFMISYIICLLPTYFLGYAGIVENGLALNAITVPSILYMLSMVGIWGICIARGVLIGKEWLVLIPTVAFIFNPTPTLTAIPFVPYEYHSLAITLGAVCPLVYASSQDESRNTPIVEKTAHN